MLVIVKLGYRNYSQQPNNQVPQHIIKKATNPKLGFYSRWSYFW